MDLDFSSLDSVALTHLFHNEDDSHCALQEKLEKLKEVMLLDSSAGRTESLLRLRFSWKRSFDVLTKRRRSWRAVEVVGKACA